MHYAELPLPRSLYGHVAAVWIASVPDGPADWVELEAVPDGCIELIRRSAGESVWRREQPALFATGLATIPAKLRLKAGSRFIGLKLWPWTWHSLGGARCRTFIDDWIEIDAALPLAALIDGAPEAIVDRLTASLGATRPGALGEALLGEATVASVAQRAGLSHRQLQRLFRRDFGMPPRSYLRLLRFRNALAGVQQHPSLADAAAAEGYADQAHMTREFRSLTGLSPLAARTRARGPFV